jgi:hypothetical protein
LAAAAMRFLQFVGAVIGDSEFVLQTLHRRLYCGELLQDCEGVRYSAFLEFRVGSDK